MQLHTHTAGQIIAVMLSKIGVDVADQKPLIAALIAAIPQPIDAQISRQNTTAR
jgi:hypothetical protein